MTSKLPPEAFNAYSAMGLARSYARIADEFGVTKRTVVRHAQKDRWTERLEEMEAKSREKLVVQAQGTLEEVNAQHLKLLKVVQARAVEALKSMPLSTPMDAVRAIDVCIRNERVILGEPADRSVVTVEDTIKREYERWMLPKNPEEGRDADG